MPWDAFLGLDEAPVAPPEDPDAYRVRRLWQARILSALLALVRPSSRFVDRDRERAEAQAWLFAPDEEHSLRLACEYAGWGVEMVRRNGRKALAGQVRLGIWKRRKVTARSGGG